MITLTTPSRPSQIHDNEDFTQSIRQARFKISEIHVENKLSEIQDNDKLEVKKFINHKFHSLECRNFIEDPLYIDEPRCLCGEIRNNHKKNKIPYQNSTTWDECSCIEVSPTESYGKIEFIGEDIRNTKLTEFARLSYKDNLDDVLDLIFNYWNIQIGALCISVIGGAKNFKMLKKEKNIFCQGLIKAVRNTNALIVTSGLNVGITKIVGDAIQEGQSYLYDKMKCNNFISCLGISSWGCVKNNSILERARGKIVSYKIGNEINSKPPILLNGNHTHFLFIDDGFRLNSTNIEAENFKTAFVKRLSQGSTVREPISVVLLIVDGGHEVFSKACKSIRENIPIVICDGTGRASDILGKTYRERLKYNEKPIRLSESYKSFLRTTLVENDVSETHEIEEAIICIEEIIQSEHLITLFDMKENQDLDVVILYSLIKRMDYMFDNKDHSISNQLSLCLIWNRADIAKDKIFSGHVSLPKSEWARFLSESIKSENVEFIELFLQNGVDMQHFLTKTLLKDLYENCQRSGNFRKTFTRLFDRTFSNGLSDVKELLTKFFGKFEDSCFDHDEEITHPFQELFIWSVLMEKHECAKFFWEKTEESLCLALVATKIYQCLAETSPMNTDRTETLSEWKDYFENLSIKLLEECHNTDQETAAYIIEKENKIWGGYTCMEIAYKAKDQRFISCMVCQSSIDFTWRAGFNINLFQCFVCIIFPFLIYKRSYEYGYVTREEEPTENSVDENYENTCANCTMKLNRFYFAPQTKFCIHSMTFFIFVVYFSYVVLFGMHRMSLTNHEIIFILYLICRIIEIFCEIFQSKDDVIRNKFKYWWNFNIWNRCDIFIMISAVIGILLRIKLGVYVWNNDSVMIYRCSKTIYSITVGYFVLRFLHLLSVNKTLGPKIVIISKMLQELILYLIIILIITLSYGVTSQAAYFPQRDFDIYTLLNIIDQPYWAIFGEITLNALVYIPFCPENTNYNGSNSCAEENYFLPVITVAYIFIASILMLNLLIAVFSYIFQRMHKNSIDIWKFKMYSLVIEYDSKPLLPLPFSILAFIYELISFIYLKYRNTKYNESKIETTSKDSQSTFVSRDKPKKIFNYEKSRQMPLESELDKLVKYFENNSQKCVVKDLVLEKDQSIESGISRLESRLKIMSSIIKNIDNIIEKFDEKDYYDSFIEKHIYSKPQIHIDEGNNELEISDYGEKIGEINNEISLFIRQLQLHRKLRENTDYRATNENKNLNSQSEISQIPKMIIDDTCNNVTDSSSKTEFRYLISELQLMDDMNLEKVKSIDKKIDDFKQEMDDFLNTVIKILNTLQSR